MNQEKVSELKKEYMESFWSISSPLILSDQREFYLKNLKKWLNNAIKIRADYPTETAFFWADIFQSEFALSFLLKFSALDFNSFDEWDLDKRIRFIKSSFEKGYEYFGFLIHCSRYRTGYFDKIESLWFQPSKLKKENLRRRSNEQGKETINKQWVLKNHPIFKLRNRGDVSFINKIRNRDSHDDTFIEDGIFYSIKNGEIIDETERVNRICKFLISAFQVSFHFHMLLIIELDFWVLPTIILKKPKNFNYKKQKVAFGGLDEIFSKRKNGNIKISLPKKKGTESLANFIVNFHRKLISVSERKLKNSQILYSEDEIKERAFERTMKVYILLIDFSLIGFWKRLERNKSLINALVSGTSLGFNDEKIEEFKNDSYQGVQEISEIFLNHISSTLSDPKHREQIKSVFSFCKSEEEIKIFISELVKKVSDEETEKLNKSIWSFSLLWIGYLIISSVATFHNRLDELFEEKPK